jgi:hypothetical protein
MPTRRDESNEAALEACDCAPRTLRALSARRSRAVMAALLEGEAPLAVDRLASRLADRLDGDPRELAVSLRHVDLPDLEGADLVTVREAGDLRVALGDNPDVADGPLAAELLAAVDAETWNALDVLHRDPVRPATLAWLDADGPRLSVDELVERLASAPPGPGPAFTPASIDELALRHQHLPRLDDVGLVAYDAASTTVSGEVEPWLPLPSVIEAVRQSTAGRRHRSLATDGGRPRDGGVPESS